MSITVAPGRRLLPASRYDRSDSNLMELATLFLWTAIGLGLNLVAFASGFGAEVTSGLAAF